MANDTGTIQTLPIQVIRFAGDGILRLPLKRGGATEIKKNNHVTLRSDDTVEVRDAGTEYPIGFAFTGEDSDQYLTVSTNFDAVIQSTAKGGTIASGSFVKPNGTYDADTGEAEVIAAVSGDYSDLIVINGGAVDTEILLGKLKAPVQIP